MKTPTLKSQLAGFIGKYTPAMAAEIKAIRARLRARFPRGVEFVYDNYNALVFGYGPTPRPSEAVLSLAAFPSWVTLCFLQGAKLADPHGLLKGSGHQVRSLRLKSSADLDEPKIGDLIARALAPIAAELPRAPALTTIIRSVSAKQRPRRAVRAAV